MAIAKILLAVLLVISYCQTSDDDYVEQVVPKYTHNWYSGYLNITMNKQIHYVYFESQNDRDNDPLIVWLSGGPGCSALHSAFYEVGPFTFQTLYEPSLSISQTAWNTRANLLFLQAPAGVGFSIGPDNSSDSDFVMDNYLALRLFFSRFPTQKKNDMYLAGHGYAGILAPKLAYYIDQSNKNKFDLNMNFKGMILGNPCTLSSECYADGRFSYYHHQYLYNHAFETEQDFNKLKGACTLNYTNENCYYVTDKLDSNFQATNSSSYNIYAKCYKGQGNSMVPNTGCEDQDGIITFLNDPNIQTKLHVGNGNWTICNPNLRRNYHDGNANGTEWLYKYLIQQKKYRIFLYSGDLDSHIPVFSTTRWLMHLKEDIDIPVRRPWREWWIPGKHPHEDQVGGMVWELEGLTFATVKGSGFLVGKDKPIAQYEILDAFLNNKRLPLTSSNSRRATNKKRKASVATQ